METDGLDPEIKAVISNLVSALGGPDPVDPERKYKLGDEALACLRDVKKWLQYYDNKLNRWDVARAISETTLISGDILAILSQWELGKQQGKDMSHQDKIAQACLEVLVPLTWPLEMNKMTTTVNQYRNAPYIRRAHLKYKRAILQHPKHVVLRAIIRLALEPMQKPLSERLPRDEGILKLVLFFFRNLLFIDSTDNQLDIVDNTDINRSTTITEFSRQKVLDFLVTMAAGMGPNFDVQDTALLECLFGIYYGIDVQDTYLVRKSSSSSGPKNGLEDLLAQEKRLRMAVFKPTRHNRFGTMVSMQLEDQSHLNLSGQKAIASTNQTLEHLDQSKKWHKPFRQTQKQAETWNIRVSLDSDAKDILKGFTGKFLDAAFNPLFTKIRVLIERDSERVSASNFMHYLYLVGWLLNAERTRHHKRIDFELVGSALNHNTFVVVMKLMRAGLDPGEYYSNDLVHSAMICFRNILEIVEAMSSVEGEWSEAADNIKSRLFYEEIWLDLLAQLPRTAKSKTLAYACESIELTHVILKMLETYSKQYTYLFVKSKRSRKKKQSASAEADMEGSEDENERSLEEATRITKERKFDFARFETRYFSESTLDTYELVLSNYNDVEGTHIKHVLAFLHRLFIKHEAHSLCFRLSLVRQLLRITSRTDGIKVESLRTAYDKFVEFYARILFKSLDRTPVLYTELLFSKSRSQEYYLDHGYENADSIIQSSRQIPDYEFKDDSLSVDRKYAIAIASLLDQDKGDFVDWVTTNLEPLVSLQQETQQRRMLTADKEWLRRISRDPLMKLLLRLVGLVEEHARFFVPPSLTALELIEALEHITKYRSETVEFDGGQMALDQIRNSAHEDTVSREVEESSDEDDAVDHFADSRLQPLSKEELLARKLAKRSEARQNKKKSATTKPGATKRKSREEQEASLVAAQQKELERQSRVKSSAFVHDSDDEENEERDSAFFAREMAQLRGELPTTVDLPSAAQVAERVQNDPESDDVDISYGLDLNVIALSESDDGENDDLAEAEPSTKKPRSALPSSDPPTQTRRALIIDDDSD